MKTRKTQLDKTMDQVKRMEDYAAYLKEEAEQIFKELEELGIK